MPTPSQNEKAHNAEQAEKARKKEAAAAETTTVPEAPEATADQDAAAPIAAVLAEPTKATRDNDNHVVMPNDETDSDGNPVETWIEFIQKGKTVKADGLRAAIHYAWKNGIDPKSGKTGQDALAYLRTADQTAMPALLVSWLAERPYIPTVEGSHPDNKPGGNKQQGHHFNIWWNRNRTNSYPQPQAKARYEVNALAAFVAEMAAHNAALTAHYAAGGKPADAPTAPVMPDLTKITAS